MSRVSPQMPIHSGSALGNFADGMVVHAKDYLYFPGDLANYILGVDSHWGERRSFWANVGLHYASWYDPAVRVVNLVNGLVLGGLNFLSAGGLYTDTEALREYSAFVFGHHPQLAAFSNRLFRTAGMYMRPPARNAYEAGEWTLDLVGLLVGVRASLEWQQWSRPIHAREALLRKIAVSERTALQIWVAELGNGDIRTAISRLRKTVTTYPSLVDADIEVQLIRGDRAMSALLMLAERDPEAVAWMKNPADMAAMASRLTETHGGIVQAAARRLMTAARFAPQEAVDAVVATIDLPGAGAFVEHTASPHFRLLNAWAADSVMRPDVMKAYAMVGHNTESVPIAFRAAECLAAMGSESALHISRQLADTRVLAGYSMMRALVHRYAKNPAALSADWLERLRQFPVHRDILLLGREPSPGAAYLLLMHAVELGNVNAITAMESMIEIAHPYALSMMAGLRKIRGGVPQHLARISSFLKTVDIGVIENDVVFYAKEDLWMSSQAAQLLTELAREGNAGAKAALLRLSTHGTPEVMEEAAARLVDLAGEGVLTSPETTALMIDSGPRLIAMVVYSSLRQGDGIAIHWDAFCNAVLAAPAFPAEVVQVLRLQARQGVAQAGQAIGHFMARAVDYRSDLIAILQEFPSVRRTVNWPLVADVAQSSAHDIGFSLNVVKVIHETAAAPVSGGAGVAEILKKFTPQEFERAANTGDMRGLAGLEILAMNGNRAAVKALRQLSEQKASGDQFFNIPQAARQALHNLSPAQKDAGRSLSATVQLQVTVVDLKRGIAATLAREIIEGKRILSTSQELKLLEDGVLQGAFGALDAIYKTAWLDGAIAAEAQVVLERLSAKDTPFHAGTLQIMVRVLQGRMTTTAATEMATEASSAAISAVAMRSTRHLETLILVDSGYADMAMQELLRQLKRQPEEMLAVSQRLLGGSDMRVLSRVSKTLVEATDEGRLGVAVIQTLLTDPASSLGKEALRRHLEGALLSMRASSPLEQLRDIAVLQ